jgi:hypothetical protein
MLKALHGIWSSRIRLNAPSSYTLQTSSFGNTEISSVKFLNNQFIAVGSSGKIATSPEAITWTQRTSSFGTTTIWDVAYGAGVYVAVGASGKLSNFGRRHQLDPKNK